MTKEEILRKRNLELVKENGELKRQLHEQEETLQNAKQIIEDNTLLQEKLYEALEHAYEYRDKYQKLIKEMQNFKKTVKGRNAIERWVFDLKRK